jgi:hypothetical protein
MLQVIILQVVQDHILLEVGKKIVCYTIKKIMSYKKLFLYDTILRW